METSQVDNFVDFANFIASESRGGGGYYEICVLVIFIISGRWLISKTFFNSTASEKQGRLL